jgi:hypothetical protein
MESTAICPELDTVIFCIEWDCYDLFSVIHAIVTSRAAIGKVVKVGHMTLDDEDDLLRAASLAWNDLCDQNLIQRVDPCTSDCPHVTPHSSHCGTGRTVDEGVTLNDC